MVMPLLIAEGCAGVLAVELLPGVSPSPRLRAVAEIVSAALAQLVLRARVAQAPEAPPAPQDEELPIARVGPPSRPMKVRRMPPTRT